VAGEVFAFETGIIADAGIQLWVQEPVSGQVLGDESMSSDAIGRFEVSYQAPDSQIAVSAHKDGYVQPCAVRAEVRGDVATRTEFRVEMIPASTLDAFNPPRPQLSAEPALTGWIFEATPNGRQPIAGAKLRVVDLEIEGYVWDLKDLGFRPFDSPPSLASTQSDRGGGFFLCNLGRDAIVYVSHPEFATREIGPIDAAQPTVLEIELTRSE
jgi:hypothetical protein